MKDGVLSGTLPMNGDIRLRRKDYTGHILENAARIAEWGLSAMDAVDAESAEAIKVEKIGRDAYIGVHRADGL